MALFLCGYDKCQSFVVLRCTASLGGFISHCAPTFLRPVARAIVGKRLRFCHVPLTLSIDRAFSIFSTRTLWRTLYCYLHTHLPIVVRFPWIPTACRSVLEASVDSIAIMKPRVISSPFRPHSCDMILNLDLILGIFRVLMAIYVLSGITIHSKSLKIRLFYYLCPHLFLTTTH